MGGVNTNQSADGFAWSSTFLGASSTSSYSQRKAGRLQPAYSGKLVRVDLSDFSLSGVQVGVLSCLQRQRRRGRGACSRSMPFDVPVQSTRTKTPCSPHAMTATPTRKVSAPRSQARGAAGCEIFFRCRGSSSSCSPPRDARPQHNRWHVRDETQTVFVSSRKGGSGDLSWCTKHFFNRKHRSCQCLSCS